MKHTHAILGGTGHIGSALAETLLKHSGSVLVIGHSDEHRQQWTDKGAAFETAEITDTDKLKKLLSSAERLFILNPPADPSGDAEATELRHIESIQNALAGLNPQKIVMASTYGAREGKDIFDLGTLYQLEQALKEQGSPLAIIRSAYHMSNFDVPVKMATESGKLSSVLPPDFALPMVAPADIADFAAALMQDQQTGTFYIQAKKQYSASDAARALTALLNKEVTVNHIPEEKWSTYLQENGFSKDSARSFVGMTKLTVEEKFEAKDPKVARTTLEDYLRQLTASQPS